MPISPSTSIAHPSVSIFLETGTFHGAGVARALKDGYKKVISIEVYEPLYRANALRYATEIEQGRVSLYCGDSAYVIADIVKDLPDPILFWFDAHDQTMNDAGVGDCKCPIIKELRSIIDVRGLPARRMDILTVDDMRLIENKDAGWNIDLTEFYSTIWEYNPDFQLTREEGFVSHDILFCKNKFLA